MMPGKTASGDNEDVTRRDAPSYGVKHLSLYIKRKQTEEKVIPSLECCLIWPHLAFPEHTCWNIPPVPVNCSSCVGAVWQAGAILAGISC